MNRDLSKFEPPKAELDGLTKELFGMPCKSEEKDNINPDHYKNSTSLECIEAMELIFGKEAVANFCVCNAWKYIWRWKHKNGLEDLEKAKWYVKKAEDFFMYSKLNLTTEEYETHKHMINSMRNYIEANNCAQEQDGDK